jgi:rod shape determining protein RodA
MTSKEMPRAVFVALTSLFILLIVGLLTLRNAASYILEDFHQRQAIWVIVGILMASFVAFVDLRIFERLAPIIYWSAIVLLSLVLLFGREVNNAKRWIDIFGLSFQPSEFAKPAVVLMLAHFFHHERSRERYTLKRLLRPMGYVLLPAGLIIAEPDLGTALVVIAVGFSIMFFEGVRLTSFLTLLAIVLLCVPIAWKTNIIRPYQKERIRIWLHMAKDDSQRMSLVGKEMQPEQAQWAVGSGGLLGRGGLGALQSKLRFLPEMHTDFVLATFAEERGFIGTTLLLVLYTTLIVSLLVVAISSKERFAVLVSIGAVAILFWQIVFNIGMVLGLLPVVGLTLPFMSYGGSATVASLFSVGLALNAGIHRGHA